MNTLKIIKNRKPQACFDCGCPLAEVGRGFVLGYGDPRTASLGIQLEAPGPSEVDYHFDYGIFGELDDQELKRRVEAYPALTAATLTKGAALVGASWRVLEGYVLKKFGITRDKLFIDNVLRCLPPEHNGQHYPTGETRKLAERCCRQYDRWGEFFKGREGLAFVSIHPASLMGQKRDITPLPLLIHTFSKAVDAARSGWRVVTLLGEKSMKEWLGLQGGVTKWEGTYGFTRGPVTPGVEAVATLREERASKLRSDGKPSMPARNLRTGKPQKKRLPQRPRKERWIMLED